MVVLDLLLDIGLAINLKRVLGILISLQNISSKQDFTLAENVNSKGKEWR
jgi:hypothetical protein